MRLSANDATLRQMVSEYCEMPGLRLTSRQAGRLWHLTPERAASLLDELVELHFLLRTTDGRYARRSPTASDPFRDLAGAPGAFSSIAPPTPAQAATSAADTPPVRARGR